MEEIQAKSISDPSINSDELVEVLSQEIQSLVISCRDEVLDQDVSGCPVVIDDDGEVKRATGEEPLHLVVKEAVNEALQADSLSASGEKNRTKKQNEENPGRPGKIKCKPVKGKKKLKEENPERSGQIECKPLKGTKKQKEENLERLGQIECKPLKGTKKQKEDNPEKFGQVECKQPLKGRKKQKEENPMNPGQIECKPLKGTKKQKEENRERPGQVECKGTKKQMEENPVRPGQIECKPLKGSKKQKKENPEKPGQVQCKPLKGTKKQKEENPTNSAQIECKPLKGTKKQKEVNPERPAQIECKPLKGTKKQKEENPGRPGQTECKFYLSSGCCKYGKSCKFDHSRGKTVVTPVVEYNFMGLPIRPGEKECAYYMRNGSCKYGPNCRLNHPDPTAVGDDAPATYGNDGPVQLQSASQPNIPFWSAPITPDMTTAFVPVMYSPTQSMLPPTPDWNGYQVSVPAPSPAPAPAHIYPNSERGLPIPPAFYLNNPPNDTNMYTHHQPQMLVLDSSERPGQPDCSCFMENGDYNYRSACKFHHPKSRITIPAPINSE